MIVLRYYPRFVRYWLGDVLAIFVSQIIQIAVLWHLAGRIHATHELGWFVFFSMVPVLIGGYLASWAFSRIGIQATMTGDLALRGVIWGALGGILLIEGHVLPVIYYTASALNGFTFMATVAGGPNIWPRLLPASKIDKAMAMEQVGWNMGALGGPVVGAGLVMWVPLGLILVISGVVYVGCAVNLGTLSLREEGRESQAPTATLWEAVGIIVRHRDLWLSTITAWFANGGAGILVVLVPLLVRFWHGTALWYGGLSLVEAWAGIVGAALSPRVVWPKILALRFIGAQLLAGASLTLLWLGVAHPLWGYIGFFLSAMFGSVSSVVALKIRFERTTLADRPAVMTVVRSFLHLSGPFGALGAGLLFAHLSFQEIISIAVALSILPNLFGLTLYATTRP